MRQTRAQLVEQLRMLGRVDTDDGVQVRTGKRNHRMEYRLAWYVVDADGHRRRRQSWATDDPATAVDRALAVRSTPATAQAPVPAGPRTMGALVDAFLESGYHHTRAQTTQAQKSRLLRKSAEAYKSLPLSDLTDALMVRIVESAVTVDAQHRTKAAWRELLGWAHRAGHVPLPREDYLARIHLPRRPAPTGGRVLTPALHHTHAFIDSVVSLATEKWGADAAHEVGVMLHLWIVTGLRPGEMYALRVRDVDIPGQTLRVAQTLAEPIGRGAVPVLKATKSESARIIHVPPVTYPIPEGWDSVQDQYTDAAVHRGALAPLGAYPIWDALVTHIRGRMAQYGPLAPSALLFPRLYSARPRRPQVIDGLDADPIPEGQRFWTRGPFSTQVWNPARASVPSFQRERYTPYSLRHLHATHRLTVLGHPVAVVAADLGHADLALVWRRYVDRNPRALRGDELYLSEAQRAARRSPDDVE